MIKGLLFDYGGTIDTNGRHWGSVLWAGYQKYGVPVDRATFAKAYAFGERSLAIHPIVKPENTFYDVLKLKLVEQFCYLKDQGFEVNTNVIASIADDCNRFARHTVGMARPVLETLAERYPLVMVSNFYGNLNTVLADFNIRSLFQTVVESAVVGVRKPDPRIYQLGLDALQLPAETTVVIGDSYTKDIQPARQLGCKTVWMNVVGWDEIPPGHVPPPGSDAEITDFDQLPEQIRWLDTSKAI